MDSKNYVVIFFLINSIVVIVPSALTNHFFLIE